MCGIFGSTSVDEFYDLCKLNSTRGDFSTGVLMIHPERQICIKQQGLITKKHLPLDGTYYLGHVRAPTVQHHGFSFNTTHPFCLHDSIFWAHNGIISVSDLENKYQDQFNVDSEWIGELYSILPLHEAISEITGTYGIWIYNNNTKAVHIVRGDNTLYLSPDKQSFSSAPVAGWTLIENDVVYCKENSEQFSRMNLNIKHKQRKYFIPYEY